MLRSILLLFLLDFSCDASYLRKLRDGIDLTIHDQSLQHHTQHQHTLANTKPTSQNKKDPAHQPAPQWIADIYAHMVHGMKKKKAIDELDKKHRTSLQHSCYKYRKHLNCLCPIPKSDPYDHAPFKGIEGPPNDSHLGGSVVVAGGGGGNGYHPNPQGHVLMELQSYDDGDDGDDEEKEADSEEDDNNNDDTNEYGNPDVDHKSPSASTRKPKLTPKPVTLITALLKICPCKWTCQKPSNLLLMEMQREHEMYETPDEEQQEDAQLDVDISLQHQHSNDHQHSLKPTLNSLRQSRYTFTKRWTTAKQMLDTWKQKISHQLTESMKQIDAAFHASGKTLSAFLNNLPYMKAQHVALFCSTQPPCPTQCSTQLHSFMELSSETDMDTASQTQIHLIRCLCQPRICPQLICLPQHVQQQPDVDMGDGWNEP